MPPRLKNFLEPDEIALYVCCAHHTEATLVTTTAPNNVNTTNRIMAGAAALDNNNDAEENENDENDLLANEDDDWQLAAAAVNNNNTVNNNLNAATAATTNTATTGNVSAMNTAVDFEEEEESEDEEDDDDLWPLATATAQHPNPPLAPANNLQTQHVFRPTTALASPPPAPQQAAPPQPLQWQLPQPPPPPRPTPPQALLPPPPAAALAPGTASATPALLPDSLLVPSLEAATAHNQNNHALDLPLQPPLLHPTLSSPQEESAQQLQQPASLHYQGPSFATLLAASQHLTHQEEGEDQDPQDQDPHPQDQSGDNDNTEEEDQDEDDEDQDNVWHRRILPSAAFDEGSSSSEGGDDQEEGSESWNSTTAAAVASALTTTTTATTAPRMVHQQQPRPSSGVARIDVLNQASSVASAASSYYASRVILLNPETTTYQDLQHVAANGHHHGALPDLMQAIDQYQSPRLTALGVRLLADYARHSVHVFFHAAPPLLQYLIERVLLNPLFQGHTDLLDTAAQVFRSLSTHELMDPMLLSAQGGSSSACGSNVSFACTTQQGVLPALSFVAQGGGVVPPGMITTCTTTLPMLLDDANDSRLDLPRVPAPQHNNAVFSFDDGHRSSNNPDAPLLAPRFSSATAQHVSRAAQQPLLSVFQASSSSTTTATAYPQQQQQTPQAPPSAPVSAHPPHPHGPWLVFSDTARAHVCICLMNLSCGPANKAVMARHCPSVLAALRALLLDSSKPSLQLKAVTTLKHLSNLESNDTPLITFPGLVHALGQALLHSISLQGNATACTTHACMALMNLSISKAHKAAVYHTPGIMQALLTVLDRTSSHCTGTLAHEARVRACCVLSNLAIGYDNKWSMFNYPGLVDAILNVMSLTPTTDNEGNNDQAQQQQDTQIQQVRSKACSILWSLAAEKANQAPLVQTTRAVPVLVQIASESRPTDARQKCVAALTLLAESPDNAVPLLHAGILDPLISILHQAGPDPTQWKDHTASWCVSCLMNLAQVDAAVPVLVDAGVVSTLAPLVHMDQEYQSLKAAMAVTLTSRLDTCRMGQETSCVDYALLRKMETVIPKMVSLLFNTLAGRGGEGYRYGVFTLSSSVACLAALAQNGPEFVQELVSTTPVCVSLLQVVWDFCVDGGTDPTIVGGGRNDVISAKWAIQALHAIVVYLNSSSSTDDVLGKNNLAEPLMRALKDAHKRFADHATGGGDAHVRAMISHTLSLLTEGGVGRPPSSSLSSLSVDDDDGVSSTDDEEATMMQLEDDDNDKNENRSSSNVPQEAADVDMISTPQPPQRQQELPSSSSSLSSRRVVSNSSSSAPSTPTTGKRKQPDAPSSSVSDSASAPAAGYHPGSSQEAGAADNFFSPVSVVAIDLPDFGDDSSMVRKPLRRRSSDPSGGGPGNRHNAAGLLPAPRPIMTTQQQQQQTPLMRSASVPPHNGGT